MTPDDIVLNSVSTTDSNELTVNYSINSNLQAKSVQKVDMGIFRSDEPVYDPNDHNNVEVASYDLSENQLNPGGNQTITVNSSKGVWEMNANTLVSPLAIDPSLPYVLAVVDPNGQLPADVTTDSSQADFRIYTIAAVTHGFTFTPGNPAWVEPMVKAIQAQGFNDVFPVYWNASAGSGQTKIAGDQMFEQIVANADCLPGLQDNDIIDVQLIGHSRGSAVIDRAMLDLQASEGLIPVEDQEMAVAIDNAGAIPQQLVAGFYKLTFLDPHPANSSTVSLASLSPLPFTDTPQILQSVDDQLSSQFQDPPLFVPARVNQVEDYFQQTPTSSLSFASALFSPWENYINFWGLTPSGIKFGNTNDTIVKSYYFLPALGLGHSEVWQWYEDSVIPSLAIGGSPPPIPLAGSSSNSTSTTATKLIVYPSIDLNVDAQGDLDPAAGAPFTLYVLAVNAQGNQDTGFSGTVELNLANNPGNSSWGGFLTSNAINGIAVFSGITLDSPGSGYTFQAGASGLNPGVSPPIDVYTDQLVVTTPPPNPVITDPPFGLVVTAGMGPGIQIRHSRQRYRGAG